jgi:hypothetical protein
MKTALNRESNEHNLFRNHYRCDDCDLEWCDVWPHTCNDRCPTCRREVEPYHSEDVDESESLRN